MKVEFDDGAEKPEGIPCQHLCKGGCSIYENRPFTCKGFECLWLGSQRWKEMAWSNSERPDRTGVVIEVNSKGNTIVHCKTPQAWRSERVFKRLERLNRSSDTNIIIEHGDGNCSVFEKDGSVTPMKFTGVDPVSNERKFVRIRT